MLRANIQEYWKKATSYLSKPKQKVLLKAPNCLQLLCSYVCCYYCCTGVLCMYYYTRLNSLLLFCVLLLRTTFLCCLLTVLLCCFFCLPCISTVTHHTSPPPIFCSQGPDLPNLFGFACYARLRCVVASGRFWKYCGLRNVVCCAREKNNTIDCFLGQFVCWFVFFSAASRQYRESRQRQRRSQATDIRSWISYRVHCQARMPNQGCVGCSRWSRFLRFSVNVLDRSKLEKNVEPSRSHWIRFNNAGHFVSVWTAPKCVPEYRTKTLNILNVENRPHTLDKVS